MSNPFLGLGFKNSFMTFSRPSLGLGALYDFTTFTFVSANKTIGETGPTQADFDSASEYTSQDWYSSYFSVTDGIQYWTAPSTGSYTIRAAGAAGVNGQNANGNKGIIIESTIELTRGQQYKILCGLKGSIYINTSYPSGGGGGTFMTALDNTAVIIAGGGGGGFSSAAFSNGLAGTSGASVTGANGGRDGNGAVGVTLGGGGGGLLTDGGGGYRGKSFISGGLGAVAPASGGFGGGGGGTTTAGQGNGGGGGYSGGGGGFSAGGGGGSYSQTSITTIGLNQSYGYLIITKTH